MREGCTKRHHHFARLATNGVRTLGRRTIAAANPVVREGGNTEPVQEREDCNASETRDQQSTSSLEDSGAERCALSTALGEENALFGPPLGLADDDVDLSAAVQYL